MHLAYWEFEASLLEGGSGPAGRRTIAREKWTSHQQDAAPSPQQSAVLTARQDTRHLTTGSCGVTLGAATIRQSNTGESNTGESNLHLTTHDSDRGKLKIKY